MLNEKQNLEKACEDLEAAVRRAALLTLQALQQEQKKAEAAAWQAAWNRWNADGDESARQGFEAGGQTSEGLG